MYIVPRFTSHLLKIMSFELIGAWVASGLTLFMFTFLYKDNPFFKFGEHLYVGVSVGYIIIRIYYDVMVKGLYHPMIQESKWWLIFPAILGILLLTRFVPKFSWLSRVSFAFLVGFGSGVAIPRIVSSYVLQQVQGTLNPLLSLTNNGNIAAFSMANFNTLLILTGVISVLVYFFYSIEHTGIIHITARTGIYFLMVSFGAAFGYTVMARMSLLIGRLTDLIRFSSKEYGYASIVLFSIVSLTLLVMEIKAGRK